MKGNMGVARRIISMLLVMSILINILPNFGVLTNKVEAATSNPHIILEIDKEYGLATNVAGGTIFALNLYIEDLNATAFEIPILYDNNKIKPGQVMVMGTMIAGSEATTVANFTSNMATDTQYSSADGEKMRVDTSETEKTLMGTGFVDLYFNRESYNNFDITDKTLITKFYFLIPAGSSITTIEQIDSSIISLDSTKFRIYNFEADEGQQEDFSASNYSMKYAAEEQVSATITSIAVSNDPKNVYTTKENFTSEGMVVTATYSDDSTKELTSEEYTVSEVNLSTAGVKEITITYKEDDKEAYRGRMYCKGSSGILSD